MDKDRLLTASEFARWAGYKPRAVQYWAQRGWVPQAREGLREGILGKVVEAPLWAWEYAAENRPKRGPRPGTKRG